MGISRLRPRSGDADAAYTHAVYNLDHPRKQRMRRFRHDVVEEALHVIESFPRLQAELLTKAEEQADPDLVKTARALHRVVLAAWRNLELFLAVPADADERCGCQETTNDLPQLLAEQVIDVTLHSGDRRDTPG
jgi:hypothetical protein